jgi:uncharacterized protein (TIGR03437 family)
MKRLLFFAAAQILMGTAWAQGDIVSVRVDAQPCGRFSVDGQSYDGAAIFLWPVGSLHTLAAEQSFPVSDGTVCQIGGWTTTSNLQLGSGSVITITVPGPITLTLAASYQYRVTLRLSGSGPSSFSCAAGNGVSLNGTCHDTDFTAWFDAGSALLVVATPPPGWLFTGWGGTVGAGSQSTTLNLVVDRPMALLPQFALATLVNVTTDPPGLLVLGDQTRVATPYTFYWAPGSTHGLSAVSPQTNKDTGAQYAFVSWSEGGPVNGQFTVPLGVSPVNLTATFGPGAYVSFSTVPQGLKLVIDGLSTWTSYNFVWAVGTKHTISAPLQQTDKNGRKYVFKEWSNGGAPDQEYTVGPVGSPATTVATYDVLGELKILAWPSDVNAIVDGTACMTPCTIDRAAGTKVNISVPATIASATDTRLDFQSWSDGVTTPTRVWTAGTALLTIQANYVTSYRLDVVADPAGSGSFSFSPGSADGYFPANTSVTVTESPKTGYKFDYWAGDFESPLAKSVTVVISGPTSLRAVFEKAPFLAVDAVRNAAGETPEAIVAAGSIISITGENLAANFEQGPADPLTQTLLVSTVQVLDRYLPLFFVSPSKINAQLFSDLPAGEYTLTVHQDGQPDVSGKFTIKRNAPGLFTMAPDPISTATANAVTKLLGKPAPAGNAQQTSALAQADEKDDYALALHQDGTSITPDSPAKHGETITLLGTGFGPYSPVPLDGFKVPEQPAGLIWALIDPVEIRMLLHPVAGIEAGVVPDTVLTPVSAQAEKGYVGTTGVQLTITADLPSATTVQIWAAVKDPADPEGKTFHESNKVLLPLQ